MGYDRDAARGAVRSRTRDKRDADKAALLHKYSGLIECATPYRMHED